MYGATKSVNTLYPIELQDIEPTEFNKKNSAISLLVTPTLLFVLVLVRRVQSNPSVLKDKNPNPPTATNFPFPYVTLISENVPVDGSSFQVIVSELVRIHPFDPTATYKLLPYVIPRILTVVDVV